MMLSAADIEHVERATLRVGKMINSPWDTVMEEIWCRVQVREGIAVYSDILQMTLFTRYFTNCIKVQNVA